MALDRMRNHGGEEIIGDGSGAGGRSTTLGIMHKNQNLGLAGAGTGDVPRCASGDPSPSEADIRLTPGNSSRSGNQRSAPGSCFASGAELLLMRRGWVTAVCRHPVLSSSFASFGKRLFPARWS